MDEKAPTGTVNPWRVLFPRRSALRRGSDRLELAARWTVLFTVLLLVPFVLSFGSTVGDDAEHRGAIARAARHPVTATVVAPPRDRSAADPGRTGNVERATVRWIGRDDHEHVGSTSVVGNASPGSTTGMWVDDAEHPRTRPPAPGEGWTAGAIAASVLLATVAILAFVVLRTVGWLLDRRRLRDWEREWEVVGRLGRGSAR